MKTRFIHGSPAGTGGGRFAVGRPNHRVVEAPRLVNGSLAGLRDGDSDGSGPVAHPEWRECGGPNKLICSEPADITRRVEVLRACLASLNSDSSTYTTA